MNLTIQHPQNSPIEKEKKVMLPLAVPDICQPGAKGMLRTLEKWNLKKLKQSESKRKGL